MKKILFQFCRKFSKINLLFFTFLIAIFSCLLAEEVSIQIENQYIEKVTDCKLGEHSLGNLEKGAKTEIMFFPIGEYDFSCKTASEFIITAKILLTTKKKYLSLIINKEAKLTIN